jgi:hypothetical protein
VGQDVDSILQAITVTGVAAAAGRVAAAIVLLMQDIVPIKKLMAAQDQQLIF